MGPLSRSLCRWNNTCNCNRDLALALLASAATCAAPDPRNNALRVLVISVAARRSALQRCHALEDAIAVDEGMDESRREMREKGGEQHEGEYGVQ